jgi:hypothetical protein
MPTYLFVNEKTGEEFEELMTMSEREAYLSDNPHIRQLPPSQLNIQFRSSYSGIKNDGGWNDHMSRIAEAHPTSAVANQYGDKSSKAVKTRAAVEKWRKKRALDTSV